MRIGILTFHRAINYGAVLQCYALYKTLTDMGHDVEVIDYRPYSIEKDRTFFRKRKYKSRVPINIKIRYFFSDLSLVYSRFKTVKRFNAFISQNIRLSKTATQSTDINNHYDVIIWGSDQIWNPKICEGLDKVYWGQIELPHTKKVTYAASIGRIDILSPKHIDIIGNYIKSFDQISVREKSLQSFIKEKYNIHSELVCDPSLLLTSDAYNSLISKPDCSSFILLYLLEENEEAVRMAKSIARQLNSEVMQLFGIRNPFRRSEVVYKSNISPSVFISHIKHAKCVITNSFHAVSYSVLFNTDFYYVKRKKNNDRAYTLLDKVCLADRYITADANTVFTNIDFKQTNKQKESYRISSIDYINQVLMTVNS